MGKREPVNSIARLVACPDALEAVPTDDRRGALPRHRAERRSGPSRAGAELAEVGTRTAIDRTKAQASENHSFGHRFFPVRPYAPLTPTSPASAGRTPGQERTTVRSQGKFRMMTPSATISQRRRCSPSRRGRARSVTRSPFRRPEPRREPQRLECAANGRGPTPTGRLHAKSLIGVSDSPVG
jgi:hypothetical protein